MKLQTLFMGETLYNITSQSNELKIIIKCIFVCLTKVSRPSFKQFKRKFKNLEPFESTTKALSYKTMKIFIKFVKI
jgi:hypothetical protein